VSFLERMDHAMRRSAAWRSLFRQPYPRDERSRAYAVMNNVFLHIHPVRVRQHAVKFAYTFCLGGLSFFLFLVLTVTGVYLMFFYSRAVKGGAIGYGLSIAERTSKF
jgi:cytochrome b6